MFLSDFLKLTRDKRTLHIDLSDPCVIGSKGVGDKPQRLRESLFTLLNIESDCRVVVCHRCDHHSNNGYCLNPKHAYLGTQSENRQDSFEDDPDLALRTGRILGQFGHDSWVTCEGG